MNNALITPEVLVNSVIAVPPLARDEDLKVCPIENAKIMRHLEAGGVRTLLYGGNAMFYHIGLGEYAETLAMLQDHAGGDTTVVPSVGPAYGTSMDQAAILRGFDFPTAMVLPARDIATPAGCATGVRKLAEAYGKPIVLYIKFEEYLEPKDAKSLVEDGIVTGSSTPLCVRIPDRMITCPNWLIAWTGQLSLAGLASNRQLRTSTVLACKVLPVAACVWRRTFP